MSGDSIEQLSSKVDIIVQLLVQIVSRDERPSSIRNQIRVMNAAGMRPADIARALGKPATAVNSELAKMKKKRPEGQRETETES